MCYCFEISKSGYYRRKTKEPSVRDKENKEILELIKDIHKDSRGTYGSPRIHKEVNRFIRCNHKRTERIMKENGINACAKKKYRHTTDSEHKKPVAENLLNQKFDIQEPGIVWAGDITYISTNEGWLYLAVVIDLFNREIVGWSLDSRINESLVTNALVMAFLRKPPKKNCIFHSDRGSQYCSKNFRKKLESNDLKQSMSRKGNCWDNACVESFFHSLKVEEVYRNKYKTRKEAKRNVVEYMEIFYNRKRIHSTLNYKSPLQYERDWYKLKNIA